LASFSGMPFPIGGKLAPTAESSPLTSLANLVVIIAEDLGKTLSGQI
jgi:hypothetical protein